MKIKVWLVLIVVLFFVVSSVHGLEGIRINSNTSGTAMMYDDNNSMHSNIEAKESSNISENESMKEGSLRVRDYMEARESFMEARDSYKESKMQWIEARNTYLSQKNDQNLKNALEKLRSFLLKSDQAMVEYLNSIKVLVNENSDMPADKKADVTAKIDADISWLESKQSEINGATTRAELIIIAKDLKDKWEDIKPRQRLVAGLFLSHRLTGILNKADNISDRVQSIIDKLKAQGKDTSELERLLLDFNAKIDAAHQARQNAISTFSNIDEQSNVEARVAQGRTYIEEAHKDLRAAYMDLKKILTILKQYKVEEAKGEVNETVET